MFSPPRRGDCGYGVLTGYLLTCTTEQANDVHRSEISTWLLELEKETKGAAANMGLLIRREKIESKMLNFLGKSDGYGWFLTTGQTPRDQRGRTGLIVGSFQANYNSGKNKRRTTVSQVPL